MTSDLYLRKLSNRVTMVFTLHLTREYKLRRWIAIRLITMAAIVLDCGIEVRDGS